MHILQDTRPDLPRLFGWDTHNRGLLFSILEGRNPGEILVDNPEHPSQCIVRSGVPLTFASLDVSQSFLDEAIEYLRTTGDVALVGKQDGRCAWSAPEPDLVVERIEFTGIGVESERLHANLVRDMPGLEMREITSDRFDSCLTKDMILAFCGSQESFFAYGFGLSLWLGDEILAEGYAPVLGDNGMEIGVITAEEHRGKGYASAIFAHMIKRCLERGLSASWSCETDNPASAAIARKLGFEREQTYPVYVYRSKKP